MLHLDTFFVREHVGLLKLADTYDILDPATGALVGRARETTAGWVKLLRMFLHKVLLPARFEVRAADDDRIVLALAKGFSLARPLVRVSDGTGRSLGYLRRRLFSWRGYFRIFDAAGAAVGQVRGDWKGWNFRLEDGAGRPLGVITKKWAGLGKELFTSADQYIVQAEGPTTGDRDRKALLLAAALAIDVVYKEQG